MGCYLARNPCLYLYLKVLDAFFSFIKVFKKTSAFELSPKKILIIQLAHKGDVIMTTSILPIIKKAYPMATVGMLIGSWSKEVVQEHPLVDILHILDHPKLNRSDKSLIKKI